MRRKPKNKPGEEWTKTQNEEKDWFDGLDMEGIVDLLPVMRKTEGGSERVQMPIHNSTLRIATQIREQNSGKFKINLDVLRSMLYAGRQLYDLAYLKNSKKAKESKSYQMAKIIEEFDETNYDVAFVEELFQRLLEGYMSQGTGHYSRDNILSKIEDLKPLLSDELKERCDNFVDEELDSEEIQDRVKARIRKRLQRQKAKENKVVNIR